MSEQNQQASIVGFGTFQITNGGGGALADVLFITALQTAPGWTGGAAFPDGCKGCDIENLGPAPLYIENDGTAADATVLKIDVGQIYPVRNALALMKLMHLFCPATAGGYDLRVALNG